MALIPICNTPTDGGNIEVSRNNDCSIAHGTKVEIYYNSRFTMSYNVELKQTSWNHKSNIEIK